jgi:uncharacterized protein with HEPN domain
MSKDIDNIIIDLKSKINKLPVIHRPHKHFRDFVLTIKKFNTFIKSQHQDEKVISELRDKWHLHLDELWKYLLLDKDGFMSPLWFYDNKCKNSYNDKLKEQYHTGKITINELQKRLQNAIDNNEIPLFFERFPYVEDLLAITKFIQSESYTNKEYEHFESLINSYADIIDSHGRTMPALVLREHILLMLNDSNFDKDFYIKYVKGAEQCIAYHNNSHINKDLIFLSSIISQDIPYAQKKALGFRKFEWEAFENLYKIPNFRLEPNILGDFKQYLDGLILFESGEITEDEINIINMDSIHRISVQEKIEPAFQIIEHYLGIIENIMEDTSISRLATLRAITAIGEAINAIKILIPENETNILKAIMNLRDHLVHSSTWESFQYLDNLINNPDDKTLPIILGEISNLKNYTNQIKIWLEGDKAKEFPQEPETFENIKQFENKYTEARKKDDRDEKLSLADYESLHQSLPINHSIINPNYTKLEAFINQQKNIDRGEFVLICSNCGFSNGFLKNIHDQIKQIGFINDIENRCKQKNVDFSKIKLNLKGEDKVLFEQIKKAENINELKTFLEKLKAERTTEANKFLGKLDQIREIDLILPKQNLKDFIQGKSHDKVLFEQSLQVIFLDNIENKQKWLDAALKQKNYIESIKRDQIIQFEYSIKNIDSLKQLVNNLFTGNYISINKDPISALACEMLYGLCSNNFKHIVKYIDLLHDYSDPSLHFITHKHPISETKHILESAINYRNNMFHFEDFFYGYYREGHRELEFCRELWFSGIQNMTHGIFFPNAIKEAMFGDCKLEKLKEFLKFMQADLNRDPDKLNMYILTQEQYKILNKQIEPDVTDPTIKLIQASALGNKDEVQSLLDQNADPFISNKQNYTAFTVALENKKIALAKDFIRNKFNVEDYSILQKICDENNNINFYNNIIGDFSLNEYSELKGLFGFDEDTVTICNTAIQNALNN